MNIDWKAIEELILLFKNLSGHSLIANWHKQTPTQVDLKKNY